MFVLNGDAVTANVDDDCDEQALMQMNGPSRWRATHLNSVQTSTAEILLDAGVPVLDVCLVRSTRQYLVPRIHLWEQSKLLLAR